MARLRALSLAIGCTFLGCGGSVDDPVGSGGTPHDEQPRPRDPGPTQGPARIDGSYDLRFSSVEITPITSGPVPPPGTPPSAQTPARLDVRQLDSARVEAVFTARGGAPGLFRGSIVEGTLTLEGRGEVRGGAASGRSDQWRTLALPLGPNKGLTGEVRLTGAEQITQGDVVWPADARATATLVPDATRPQLSVQAATRSGDPGLWLPWESVVVQAAEPIDRATAAQKIALGDSAGARPKVRFAQPAPDPTDWAGTTRLELFVDSWSVTAGNRFSVLAPSGAAKDLVGLDADPLTAAVTYVALPPPQDDVGFDTDVLAAEAWGPHQLLGGGIAGEEDPRCEAGGCLRLGPFRYDTCSSVAAGLATQLRRAAGQRVELRYRVLARPQSDPGPAPALFGEVLVLELTTPGGAVVDHGVAAPQLSKLPSAVDGMTYGTPWSTVSAEPPPGAGPVGVAVLAGGRMASRMGCAGPASPTRDVVVLVEGVRTR